jgi:flagellar basal-body rod protein FlgB
MADRPISTPPFASTADAALRVGLGGLSQRQRVIANNIANADTPNFKASTVRFETELAAALARPERGLPLHRTSGDHLAAPPAALADVRPREEIVQSLTYRNDGNNVDIDAEMSALADTQIRFAALTQLMSSRLGGLRTIINEGRR